MAQTTGTILDEIVARKRIDLSVDMERLPLARVRAVAEASPPPRNFVRALQAPGVSLIAEIKRASPSAGELRGDLQPANLARTYTDHGAAACSVLTDTPYFHGDLSDLENIRQVVDVPLLRKDFTIAPYQVYEARAAGADAILLIVAILDDGELADLQALAQELGMAALVETHNQAELGRALRVKPPLLGINNRDLHTFEVDLGTTEHLRPHVPDDMVLVAESGVHTPDDVGRLVDIGVDAMLVGTALVKATDTASAVRGLICAGRRTG